MQKKETQTERQFSKEEFAPLSKAHLIFLLMSVLAQISVVVLMLCIMH